MSSATRQEGGDAQNGNDDDGFSAGSDGEPRVENLTRRQAMQTIGAAVATAAVAGTASGAAGDDTFIDDETHPDFTSDYVSDPWINATVEVNDHASDMAELEFVNDSDEVEHLTDYGYVLAREPDDEDTPHNPVSLTASAISSDEYTAFPRGTTYDDDSDDSTDEVAVEWHDPTHWSTTDATNGSIALTEPDRESLGVASSSLADGETVKATLDLSSVGSEDATIADGMSRLFLQSVADVDALPSNVSFEIAIIDSGGTEVTAAFDPAGDASTAAVLASSTGDSQVTRARVGDLEDAQSVELADIQKVELRIAASGGAADADLTFHGLNLERATEWTFGTQEYQTTDDDGSTVVETQDVTEPSGSFSVTSLTTMSGGPFADAAIDTVTYDAEQRMSELPEDRVHVRVEDTADTFDYPKRMEYVGEFESPVAYSLGVTHSNVKDVVALPSSRYDAVETASPVSTEIDEWEDVEDTISWTARGSSYDSVDKEVELIAAVGAGDRTDVRIRSLHKEGEIDSATGGGSAAVAVGGGGGGFNLGLTAIFASVVGLGAYFRKSIMAWFSG